MNYLFCLIIGFAMFNNQLLFDFNKKTDLDSWRVVDDGVMGGRSQGEFMLTKEGHGCFKGTISLENYGGFSSVRHRFPARSVNTNTALKIRLKGDGKRYQIRVKHSSSDYHSYITYVETSGKWEDITVKLSDMYPSFRGRKLDMPNFEQTDIEELTFLVANKRAEQFELFIDKISLETTK